MICDSATSGMSFNLFLVMTQPAVEKKRSAEQEVQKQFKIPKAIFARIGSIFMSNRVFQKLKRTGPIDSSSLASETRAFILRNCSTGLFENEFVVCKLFKKLIVLFFETSVSAETQPNNFILFSMNSVPSSMLTIFFSMNGLRIAAASYNGWI